MVQQDDVAAVGVDEPLQQPAKGGHGRVVVFVHAREAGQRVQHQQTGTDGIQNIPQVFVISRGFHGTADGAAQVHPAVDRDAVKVGRGLFPQVLRHLFQSVMHPPVDGKRVVFGAQVDHGLGGGGVPSSHKGRAAGYGHAKLDGEAPLARAGRPHDGPQTVQAKALVEQPVKGGRIFPQITDAGKLREVDLQGTPGLRRGFRLGPAFDFGGPGLHHGADFFLSLGDAAHAAPP